MATGRLLAALVGAGVVEAGAAGPVAVPVVGVTLSPVWLEVGVPEADSDWPPVAEVSVLEAVVSVPPGVDGAGTEDSGMEALVYGTGTGMTVVPEVLEDIETGATSLLLETTAVAVVVATALEVVDSTGEAGTPVVAMVVAVVEATAGEVAEYEAGEVSDEAVAGPTGTGMIELLPAAEAVCELCTLNPKLE